MVHPFSILRPEYEALLATSVVTREAAARAEAMALTTDANAARYEQVSAAIGVPAALIAALDMRESGANPKRALGQGDPWNQVSTHVPRGMGPFPSWQAAAEFYARYDHLDDVSAPDGWTMPYACWKAEAWNGFGPRAHGIHTGYLWAGTNHYAKGKYVADGAWDADFVDQQVGVVPMMQAMFARKPEWALHVPANGQPRPMIAPAVPAPAPAGVSAPHGVAWLQHALNQVFLAPHDEDLLLIDDSYGRRTREAVRQYQAASGLHADGLFGPITEACLSAELKHARPSTPDA